VVLSQAIGEMKDVWDRLLDLAEDYRRELADMREKELAKLEPAARRVRTLDVAIREADDLVEAIDDIVGDRLLRVQDRRVILQKIPFADEPASDRADSEADGPGADATRR